MRLKTKIILIPIFALLFAFPIFAHAGDFSVQTTASSTGSIPGSIDIPQSAELNLTDNFRIESRFTIDSCPTGGLFAGFFAQNNGDAFGDYTYMSLLDDSVDCNGFEIFIQPPGGGGDAVFHTCERTINDGNEHIVVWERNGQDFSCTIDGKDSLVFGSQGANVGTSTNTETQLLNFDHETPFPGKMSYFRIDIDGTCAGLWEFTEGSGATVADTCGSVNNVGTLVSNATWFDFLSQATGIRFMSRNTAIDSPGQLGASVIAGVGSVFPIVLLSIGVFLAFYIIQRIMFMFPNVEKATAKKGRRGKRE